MPRPALSFYTFAPVLAALFSFAAIALVAMSRPQTPPRFSDLAVIDGTLRARSSMSGATKLRITTGAREETVDVGACTALTSVLQPGDPIAVWVDKNARVWRVVRATKPICTFVQATSANDSSRHTRRVAAILLALAGVACVGATILGTRRVRLIDEGSGA